MASLIKRQFQGGSVWYIQFYRGGKQKRIKASDNYQIAKEKLRRFDSAEARGEASPLPTQTPVAVIVTAYIQHIRAIKTPKSAQTDIYYLRDVFGPICDALRVTSRRINLTCKKRPPKPGQDRRFKATAIEPTCFEAITTADIANFVSWGLIRVVGIDEELPTASDHFCRPFIGDGIADGTRMSGPPAARDAAGDPLSGQNT